MVGLGGCGKKQQQADIGTSPGSAVSEETVKVPDSDIPVSQPTAEPSDVITGDMGLRPVFFDFDKYDITAPGRETLNANARILKDKPAMRLTIEGHCDERGTTQYNLALGEKRARAAMNYLVSLGIDAGRLDIVSYGKERPFAMGHDESAWAQNRRAHFVPRSAK
ncbi:peptidoglycan-associated lipoprotein Pal [bacterium]|nr:peptidoglycan-associated lipoprotein Pal [bacterium]